jgi:hypothetical protein
VHSDTGLPRNAARGLLLSAALAACAVLATGTAARAYTFGSEVRQTGLEQTVFDWTTDSCESDDIPDLPARAFRDATGQVQMIATHWVNHRARGFDLNGVRHECATLIASQRNSSPSAYDDLQWLASPYTIDGKTVYALMHMEYRGRDWPGQCDPNLQGADRLKCQSYAIVASRSTSYGNSYTRQAAPEDLVATAPYAYVPDSGQSGYIQPSNIIYRPDGYYYATIGAAEYGDQARGLCLMRTRTLWDPASWRVWDGTGFTVRFIDPYVETSESPQDHVCTPVSPQLVNEQMAASLTYNTYLGKYIAVGTGWGPDPQTGDQITGFWYSLSDDLRTWTVRRLLMRADIMSTYQCGQPDPVKDPSLLDPTSPARNFGVTGREPYLYFTRTHVKYNSTGCSLTLDRDLVRIPLRFTVSDAGTDMPNCSSVKASPSLINSADNRWVLVTLRDPARSLSIEIKGVTQDEAPNGIIGARYGTVPDQVRLRAARDEDGDGRVYRILFTATGGNGTCWGTTRVGVTRTGTAVDDNPYDVRFYNSILPPGG